MRSEYKAISGYFVKIYHSDNLYREIHVYQGMYRATRQKRINKFTQTPTGNIKGTLPLKTKKKYQMKINIH